MQERSTIESALWRKKVDSSLFEYKVTTLPMWICNQWGVTDQFTNVRSFNDPKSQVTMAFGKKKFSGWVTVAREGRSTPAYRLWFEEDLLGALKTNFPMSYMRHLEGKLRIAEAKLSGVKEQAELDVEVDIPFWEFLDIEYEAKAKTFHLKAHFTQKPTFPKLFRALQGQPTLRKLEDSLLKDHKARIHKSRWLRREELEMQVGARNVIYYLMDSKNKRFYVGEAKDLVKRLKQPYSVIPKWDHFRYDVLPDELEPYRVTLERMVICAFSMVTTNGKQKDMLQLTQAHVMTNEKIDKA